MNFNKHSELDGLHAFLGASKYSWLNYDENKLVESYKNHLAKQRGTVLHDFARQCIELKQKLRADKSTLSLYVNDAIGYRMTPEQLLYYSPNCFGTADAISFRRNLLRIHDYKSGVTPASMHQLEIYAALFCLEYKTNPEDISIELRIYQSNEILVEIPEAETIRNIMNTIVRFDDIIESVKAEE